MPHVVAVAALRGPAGLLLAHRRPDLDYYPDCWDFPGGHLEAGETGRDALVRELREELGIEATVPADPAWELTEDPGSPEGLVLGLWVVEAWRGTPVNVATDEHDDLRWIRRHELPGLELAHPSYAAVLERLLG